MICLFSVLWENLVVAITIGSKLAVLIVTVPKICGYLFQWNMSEGNGYSVKKSIVS